MPLREDFYIVIRQEQPVVWIGPFYNSEKAREFNQKLEVQGVVTQLSFMEGHFEPNRLFTPQEYLERGHCPTQPYVVYFQVIGCGDNKYSFFVESTSADQAKTAAKRYLKRVLPNRRAHIYGIVRTSGIPANSPYVGSSGESLEAVDWDGKTPAEDYEEDFFV